jgi:hypothetical protein
LIKYLKLLALRYFPSFSKWVYRRKRQVEDREYWSSVAPFSRKFSDIEFREKIESLLILVPSFEKEGPKFGPGDGNYFYELFRSAADRYGPENVDYHHLSNYSDWIDDCRSIAGKLSFKEYSHIIFSIESNEPETNLWRWDILASELRRQGSSSTAIGFLTDGTYELHQLQCGRFHEVYPNSCFIQIDVLPNSNYISSSRIFGPTFLPISQESINLIRSRINTSPKNGSLGISFIGKIYGYRAKLIRDLEKRGLSVSVNPQSSPKQNAQASYLDYMVALGSSKFTINFSRANRTRQKQLKSRMIESLIAGTVPITDDGFLSDTVIPAEIDYLKFSDPGEISKVVEARLSGSESPRFMGSRGIDYSKSIYEIATSHFWVTLELGIGKSDNTYLGADA